MTPAVVLPVKSPDAAENMQERNRKELAMARIARAVAAVVLVIASLGVTGCLHTWTQTYYDYPPSAWDPPHTRPQGDPNDG